jgi:hypothetical protein
MFIDKNVGILIDAVGNLSKIGGGYSTEPDVC